MEIGQCSRPICTHFTYTATVIQEELHAGLNWSMVSLVLVHNALQDSGLEAFETLRPVLLACDLRAALVKNMHFVVLHGRTVLQPGAVAGGVDDNLYMVDCVWNVLLALQSQTWISTPHIC